jgi:hypothetical protein
MHRFTAPFGTARQIPICFRKQQQKCRTSKASQAFAQRYRFVAAPPVCHQPEEEDKSRKDDSLLLLPDRYLVWY